MPETSQPTPTENSEIPLHLVTDFRPFTQNEEMDEPFKPFSMAPAELVEDDDFFDSLFLTDALFDD
ncbi:hypothetical protein ACQZV8_17830 [Magnetococcales bacterium HHB-1]